MQAYVLSKEPDGFGFYYGSFVSNAQVYCINALPPHDKWRGRHTLEGYEPDLLDWIVFADGNEIGRVSQRGEISVLIDQHIQ